MPENGFSPPVAIRIGTDHRPALAPAHRLEVHDPAIAVAVLEMQEPVLARGGSDPCPLVRPVDPGRALIEDVAPFVRPLDAAAAEHALPPALHAAAGRGQIVKTVALVEFGAL